MISGNEYFWILMSICLQIQFQLWIKKRKHDKNMQQKLLFTLIYIPQVANGENSIAVIRVVGVETWRLLNFSSS